MGVRLAGRACKKSRWGTGGAAAGVAAAGVRDHEVRSESAYQRVEVDVIMGDSIAANGIPLTAEAGRLVVAVPRRLERRVLATRNPQAAGLVIRSVAESDRV